ncbi:MAG: aminotransferase class I/II-fold pyridoxal phosphate-dependent enzyme [Gammaproteobacteria bacterium]|nr:aminotransferase class I/II-fold pyridoxal phosphate-dependent enzyme [Gammaproteobacteria bacterium]
MKRVQKLKSNVNELAIFGTESLFGSPKSTSNLVAPDFDVFLNYSRVFFEHQQYTNNGALVRLLEQRLASFHQTEFCVTFCSGFWGLVLAMSALAIKGRSEVIMPSLTYRRMADIASWAKLKPHFCEVEESSLAQSAATVSRCINANTALIVAVHPFVNCCEVAELVALAQEHNIPLLFDSVESPYEFVADGKVGGFGDAECFSLHASKLLNGFEGGYLTTNNAELAKQLILVRGFGFEGKDNVKVAGGLNAKMNEVHAAMALGCLDDLEDQVLRNRQRYYTYKDQLAAIPGIRLVEFLADTPTSYKNILVEFLDVWPLTRADTLAILNAEKIYARAYYSPPLHRKRVGYPCVPVDLPLTDALAERYALLPCGHQVSEDDVRDIVGLLDFIRNNAAQIANRLRAGGKE